MKKNCLIVLKGFVIMAKINLLKQFILNINNKKFSELPLNYQQVLFNIKENIKPNNFIKVIKYISGKKNILIINIDNEKYFSKVKILCYYFN